MKPIAHTVYCEDHSKAEAEKELNAAVKRYEATQIKARHKHDTEGCLVAYVWEIS